MIIFRMRTVLVWTLILLVIPLERVRSLRAEEPGSAVDSLKDSVRRSRELVRLAGSNWKKNKTCFSCHHQTLTMLTMVETARFGFEADSEWLQVQAKQTHEHFKNRVEELRAGEHIGGGSSTTGFGLWALQLAKHPADEVTEAMVGYLLKIQGFVRLSDRKPDHQPRLKDGSWPTSCRRPPLQGSDVATTVLSLFGMEHYATEEQRPQVALARTKAEQWMMETKLTAQTDLAWRLWGLGQWQGTEESLDTVRSAIFKAQRDDGGWGETSDRPSDAYSTGETLYILLQTGTPASSQAIQRAKDYLLKTQLADGSWLVETHVKPVQTFFENGDPHGKHQFLSTSATAWSSAALTQLIPLSKQADSTVP